MKRNDPKRREVKRVRGIDAQRLCEEREQQAVIIVSVDRSGTLTTAGSCLPDKTDKTQSMRDVITKALIAYREECKRKMGN